MMNKRFLDRAVINFRRRPASSLAWLFQQPFCCALIVIGVVFSSSISAAATVNVEGKWILVGIDRHAAATQQLRAHCDGELAALVREAGAPLVALYWLHDSGCTIDWISTRVWPIGSTLRLAKRLKSLGFSESRQLGADQTVSDHSQVSSHFLAKDKESSRTDVWIHCLRATCQLYASESIRAGSSKSRARP